MRKAIGYMFGVLAIICGFAILGAGTSQEMGYIGIGAFAAYTGIFGALTGVCGYISARLMK